MFANRAWFVAASFLLAAGCEDGGRGAPARLYFGMENAAPCSKLSVSVALEQADAEVARLGDGSLDCALTPQIAAQGCSATFVESDDGSALRIELTDCEDVWDDALFACGFERVDVATINASVYADCDCAYGPVCYLNGPTCYREPGICLTENADGDGCEHCSNDVDDDGDGAVDCRDPKCWYNCGVGLTTITCTTSTIVTTTNPTTTSLDLASEPEDEDLKVSLGDVGAQP